MPFGLKMSQDANGPGNRLFTWHYCHSSDICIFGHTHEEHDPHLLHLMETSTEHGIVFNSTKCQIRQPEIAFYGAVFTAQGIWLDPSKIQALQELPTLDSQAKLQSFIGLINYLQPFIPSLSNKTTFLHEQVAKWDWNPSTDVAFQCLKAWICQTLLSATLAYYDRSKPVVVQVDASKYGLGAALIQSGCPKAFASKMLTDIKTCYVNIERVSFSMLQSGEVPYLHIW